MKNLLFSILILLSVNQLFADYCYSTQQFWKTSGISACAWTTGLNGVGITFMHDLPDGEGTCKSRAYVCENREGTTIPPGASNLPQFVTYDPNPPRGNYPYTCGKNTSTWYSLFQGAEGEGFYSCESGTATYLPNVDSINPNDQSNPLNCSANHTQTIILGFSPSRKGGYNNFMCVPNFDETGAFSDSKLDEISDSIKSGALTGKLLTDPQTYSNTDGSTTMIYPDGTKQTIYPNGALVTEYPNKEIKVDYLFGDLKPNNEGSFIKYQAIDGEGNKYFETNYGVKYLLEPNGDLTKYVEGVTIKEKVDYNTWKPKQDYGYTGKTGTGSGSGSVSSGGTGGGGDTGSGSGSGQYLDGTNIGDTANESGVGGDVPQIPEEEEEEDAKSCEDKDLTYQQKMFCEINKGFRKINQEANPEYSINNMLAKYNATMNRNEKAIAYNLQQTAITSAQAIFLQKEQNMKLNELGYLVGNETAQYSAIKTGIDSLTSNLSRLFPSLSTGGTGGGSTGGTGSNQEGTVGGAANLDEYFKADSTVNTDNVTNNTNETDTTIDSLISVYGTFANNITNSFNTIQTQIQDTKSFITGTNNIFEKQNITNCPISYQFDLSQYNLPKKEINIDICKYFSELYSLGYFLVYVSLMFVLIFSSFFIIGVLSK